MLAFAEWAPIDRPADLVHRSGGELTVFALVSIRAAAAMMSVVKNVSEKKTVEMFHVSKYIGRLSATKLDRRGRQIIDNSH